MTGPAPSWHSVWICVFILAVPVSGRQVHRSRDPARGSPRDASSQHIPPPTGQLVRLSGGGGANYTAGGVEVFLRGKWGVVCDDKWDIENANVACGQLGFDRLAASALVGSVFGSRGWEPEDILMDDVECHGDEANLQDCASLYPSNCDNEELAGVICHRNKGCPEDWVAGPSGCYRLLSAKTTRRKFGINKCIKHGGYLVNIETEAENHFLSHVFLRQIDGPVLTGGYRDGTGGWLWERVSGADPDDSLPRTRTEAPVEITKWFPGWGPDGVHPEPSDENMDRCLFLSNLYSTATGEPQQDAGYLWWRSGRCTAGRHQQTDGFQVLCERPKDVQDTDVGCFVGNGAEYRGTASRTASGEACIPWSRSGGDINDRTHPDAGLDENYCRNPDFDEKPWCWITEDGDFGYCDIPECPEGYTPPRRQDKASEQCENEEFYCPSDRRCVSSWWRCDHEIDCSSGEDEVDCDYKVNLFKKTPWKRIRRKYIRESYVGTTNETCAVHCVNRENFVCLSFAFDPSSRECFLSDHNTETMDIVSSSAEDYYELISQTGDCTDRFLCRNGRCIENSLVCNGHNDCSDFSDEASCGDRSSTLEVRLADGDEDSGRVEVKYLGEWGQICDNSWDEADAAVVCRMLGFTTGVPEAKLNAAYGHGDGNFLLDDVECTGNETSLDQCAHSGWGNNYCFIWEVAGVDCNTPKVVTVQLVDGDFPHEGRVEVIIKGVRGTVCDDGWDDVDASVVCRSLGYKDGVAVGKAHFGQGSRDIMMDDVGCTGDEESLGECPHVGSVLQNCRHNEDAGVICNPLPEVCSEDMFSCGSPDSCVTLDKVCDTRCDCTACNEEKDCEVRVELVGGRRENEGRVEVIRNGVRGTVCDDAWEDEDAKVVCRSLGYREGVARTEAHFGEGTGVIWFDNVECRGDEPSLVNCSHVTSANHNCEHSEDAGVVCHTKVDQFAVELVGGDGTFGRLEVIWNGQRGTVCDDSWDDEDAEVVCQMLGLSGGQAYKEAYFGQGSEDLPILLDDTVCSGRENSLLDCGHRGLGKNNCDHSEDAGVRCESLEEPVSARPTETTAKTTTRVVTTRSTRRSTPPNVVTTPNVPSPPDSHSPDEPDDCLRDSEQYRGRHSHTKSGLQCQAWAASFPHHHKHINSTFPDGRAEDAANYCRSPDGDVKLWCYTTDPDTRWEYCQIPYCDESCYRAAVNYRGRVSQTTTGKQCQPWASNSPHRHRYHEDILYPDGSETSAQNFCRSPDGDTRPWCLTTDKSSRAEYCDIPRCPSLGFDFNVACGQRPLEQPRMRRDARTPDDDEEDETDGINRFLYMKRGRIVGGHQAAYGMYPWQVGVRKQLSPYYGVQDQRWCGGTIISEYWVISAAHCFRELNRAQVILRVGDLNNEVTDEYEEMFEVDVILPHENFVVTNAFDYDLALLRIRPKQGRGIVFSDHVQPACLPEVDTPYTPGQKCFISGWGNTGQIFNGYPRMLMAAGIPIMDDATCKKIYGPGEISPYMFCAGYIVGGIDTCAGDSGGPLVCKINDRYTLMGVTSWGGGCAKANAPGVYAKVASMIPWIKDTLQNY